VGEARARIAELLTKASKGERRRGAGRGGGALLTLAAVRRPAVTPGLRRLLRQRVHAATPGGYSAGRRARLTRTGSTLPIGYHAVRALRAVRPHRSPPRAPAPGGVIGVQAVFGPSRRLDCEADGRLRGRRRPTGPFFFCFFFLPVADFAEHVFGGSCSTTWSSRDLQAWSYQTLGRSCHSRSPPRSRPGGCLDALEHARVSPPPRIRSRCPTWRGRRPGGLGLAARGAAERAAVAPPPVRHHLLDGPQMLATWT